MACKGISVAEFGSRLMTAVQNSDEPLTREVLTRSIDFKDEASREEVLDIGRQACIMALERSNLTLVKLLFTKRLVFVDGKLHLKINQNLVNAAIKSDFVQGLKFLESKGLVFESPVWNALRESVELGKQSTVDYLLQIPLLKLHLKWPFDKSLLSIAAGRCDYCMLRTLLNSEAKQFINERCKARGFAALHHCIVEGRKVKHQRFLECVRLLLEKGADVNQREGRGERDQTPLLMVAEAKTSETFSNLLLNLIDAGADTRVRDGKGKTVLHYLAESSLNWDPDIMARCVERILEDGLNINAIDGGKETALYVAAGKWNRPFLKALINHGCELNIRCGSNSWTALMLDFIIRDPIGIQILLDGGADCNMDYNNNDTFLMKACRNGWPGIVKTLIKKGVDVHARSREGQTALSNCRDEMGSSLGQILPMLLEAGVDVLEDDSGPVFLNLAIKRMDLDAIDFLVRLCPAMKEPSRTGETLMHRFARVLSERDDLHRLFQYGLDVNQPETIGGSTPLMEAASRGNVRFIKLLMKHGCDVNIVDHQEESALFKAARNNKRITVKLLLKSGADVNILNSDGQPAMNCPNLQYSDPDAYIACLRWILYFGGGAWAQIEDRTIYRESREPHIPDFQGLNLLERLLHHRFVEPVWLLITANTTLQLPFHKVPDQPFDRSFLPLAKAIYESGCRSKTISSLLDEEPRREYEEFLKNGLTLKSLARRALRQHLHLQLTETVRRLSIPPVVKDYILMKDVIPPSYSSLGDGLELNEDEEPKLPVKPFEPSADFLKYM